MTSVSAACRPRAPAELAMGPAPREPNRGSFLRPPKIPARPRRTRCHCQGCLSPRRLHGHRSRLWLGFAFNTNLISWLLWDFFNVAFSFFPPPPPLNVVESTARSSGSARVGRGALNISAQLAEVLQGTESAPQLLF